MTEERERELLRHIRTLRCAGEIEGFRDGLRAQGENPSSAVVQALAERERMMGKSK